MKLSKVRYCTVGLLRDVQQGCSQLAALVYPVGCKTRPFKSHSFSHPQVRRGPPVMYEAPKQPMDRRCCPFVHSSWMSDVWEVRWQQLMGPARDPGSTADQWAISPACVWILSEWAQKQQHWNQCWLRMQLPPLLSSCWVLGVQACSICPLFCPLPSDTFPCGE